MKADSIRYPVVQNIRMTNNIRVFLWLGLALALWINYSQWQIDYGPKATSVAGQTSGQTSDSSGPKPPSLEETVPQAAQTAPEAAVPAAGSVPVAAPDAAAPAAVETAGIVRVTTDVLVLDIDLKGGTLVYAELPGYPVVKGEPAPMVLFNRDSAATNYVLQTGLSGATSTDRRPTHIEIFTAAAQKYELAPGQDELRVPLTWTDGNGVTVTKTYVFRRGMFAVGIEYSIANQSPGPWVVHSYARIARTDAPVERSRSKWSNGRTT